VHKPNALPFLHRPKLERFRQSCYGSFDILWSHDNNEADAHVERPKHFRFVHPTYMRPHADTCLNFAFLSRYTKGFMGTGKKPTSKMFPKSGTWSNHEINSN
jgi:hypothetical protein